MLSQEEKALIQFQESLAEEALSAIKRQAKKTGLNYEEMADRIKALRDEASKAKESDLPALFDQINSTKAIFERSNGVALPSPIAPYFAHMRLKEGKKERHILIGQRTFLEGDTPIIDWRHAPIAKIYFKYRVGDEYEEQLPGRIARGEVLERTILTFDKGSLVAISAGGEAYVKSDGSWSRMKDGFLPTLKGGAGTANRGKRFGTGQGGSQSADVSALLDKSQYEVLSEREEEPILILGTAGSGKTTVALHRLSSLVYKDPKSYPQSSLCVIVPEKGLASLSSRLLASLDLSRVRCLTYDDWVYSEAQLLLRKLPRKLCDETPYAVLHMKRHPSMLLAIKALLDDRKKALRVKIGESFKKAAPLLEYFDKNREKAIVPLIKDLSKLHAKLATSKQRQKVVLEFYEKQILSLKDHQKDREDLLLNEKYLNLVVEGSKGQLSMADAQSVLGHSIDQMGASPYDGLEHMDKERLETVDGRSLVKEARSDSLYKSIDIEDFTLLIHLERLKLGKEFNWLRPCLHLLVDEAQELSPLELEVLALSLKNKGALTVAGDEAQAIDASSHFAGWDKTMEHLGVKKARQQRFMTAYRSTKAITDFAHRCLGEHAPKVPPKALKQGVDVALSLFPNEGHAMLQVAEALTDLVLEEPQAYIAVIAKEAAGARRIFQALKEVPKVRLAEDGAFSFVSGIEVTSVSEVKGLEFDYVVIPDASFDVYKDTPKARRQFHVAATRAIHQLWVVAVGKGSPIVSGSFSGG